MKWHLNCRKFREELQQLYQLNVVEGEISQFSIVVGEGGIQSTTIFLQHVVDMHNLLDMMPRISTDWFPSVVRGEPGFIKRGIGEIWTGGGAWYGESFVALGRNTVGPCEDYQMAMKAVEELV